ncbi:lysozyme inhibitor LprI family protein [Bacillus sp. JCM 19034]|uniref:lysozyme inhibitor LprI family protein n=1 Tax=Bacillus sp. JCM 19034 TaxID=1481928 RepID=UPI000782F8BD|nr:lysozyme inhibitor LprI family protein [Bacillus sp. JCM 19034]
MDNITEEIEAEEKRRQEEREIEAENTLEEKELGAVETIQTSELHSNRDTYFQKVFVLEQEILTEAQQLYAHDIPHGFYGQYYSDWDDLLQEVWDVLKETMPIEEFELIKSEQIQWIEMKEQNFAEMPDENASARAEGMDYLVHITTERVVYLIENFMD